MGLYDDRKTGVGITAFCAHTGDVANYYGEKSFAEMKVILERSLSRITSYSITLMVLYLMVIGVT